MSKTVAIFEPIYSQDQTLTCAEFLPLVRADNARPEWREFKILTDMYRNGEHLRHDYTGLFFAEVHAEVESVRQCVSRFRATPRRR